MFRKLALIGALSALTLGMAGCDDDDTPAAAAASFLSGTAAVGAPIPNGTVTADCTGATGPITVTTGADGKYTITTEQATEVSASLPCALRIVATGFPTLFSVAREGVDMTANITPLTSLAVERAAVAGGAANAGAWFTGGADFTVVTPARLTTALNAVQNALLNAIPAGSRPAEIPFNIFATPFTADSANSYDIFLDAFWAAAGGNAGYPALATTFGTTTVSNFGGSFVVTLPEGTGNGTLTITTSVAGFAGAPVTVNNSPVPEAQAGFCAAFNAAGGMGYVPGLSGVTCTWNPSTLTGTISGTITNVIAVSYVITYHWTVAA